MKEKQGDNKKNNKGNQMRQDMHSEFDFLHAYFLEAQNRKETLIYQLIEDLR